MAPGVRRGETDLQEALGLGRSRTRGRRLARGPFRRPRLPVHLQTRALQQEPVISRLGLEVQLELLRLGDVRAPAEPDLVDGRHSLPEIGDSFGGRDHTTVLHAVRKIAQERTSDPECNHQLHVLEQTLKG